MVPWGSLYDRSWMMSLHSVHNYASTSAPLRAQLTHCIAESFPGGDHIAALNAIAPDVDGSIQPGGRKSEEASMLVGKACCSFLLTPPLSLNPVAAALEGAGEELGRDACASFLQLEVSLRTGTSCTSCRILLTPPPVQGDDADGRGHPHFRGL
jgi:hypothetical protein